MHQAGIRWALLAAFYKNICSILFPNPPGFPVRRETGSAAGKVCCQAERLAKSVLSADGKVWMGASGVTSGGGWLQPGTVPKPESLGIVKGNLPTIHLQTYRGLALA